MIVKWFFIYVIFMVMLAAAIVIALVGAVAWMVVTALNRNKVTTKVTTHTPRATEPVEPDVDPWRVIE